MDHDGEHLQLDVVGPVKNVPFKEASVAASTGIFDQEPLRAVQGRVTDDMNPVVVRGGSVGKPHLPAVLIDEGARNVEGGNDGDVFVTDDSRFRGVPADGDGVTALDRTFDDAVKRF